MVRPELTTVSTSYPRCLGIRAEVRPGQRCGRPRQASICSCSASASLRRTSLLHGEAPTAPDPSSDRLPPITPDERAVFAHGRRKSYGSCSKTTHGRVVEGPDTKMIAPGTDLGDADHPSKNALIGRSQGKGIGYHTRAEEARVLADWIASETPVASGPPGRRFYQEQRADGVCESLESTIKRPLVP